MAIITQTIGSASRNFATISAWAAALPANLVTDGNSYVGQCFNDSEFTESSTVVINQFTDASHTITLTTGTGQSFVDNANVRTNGLTYNQANGAAFHSSGARNIQFQTANWFLSNMQLKGDTETILSTSGTGVISNCILMNTSSNNLIRNAATSVTLNNCLIYGVGANIMCYEYFTIIANFCTFVGPSDNHSSTYLFDDTGGTGANGIFRNCAFFGGNTFIGGTNPSFTTCATDLASPPTGVTGSLTYANQFIATASSAPDFRAKAGADLINAGTPVGGITTDISGFTRNASTPTIGAWEFAAAAGTPVWLYRA